MFNIQHTSCGRATLLHAEEIEAAGFARTDRLKNAPLKAKNPRSGAMLARNLA
jgi:hypothetical protein